MSDIDFADIVKCLNAADRDEGFKYAGGYEFFYMKELKLKLPIFLSISPEDAEQHRVTYLEQLYKTKLGYDNINATTSEPNKGNIVIYRTPDGQMRVEGYFKDDSIWMSQKQIAKLFYIGVPAVNEHIRNIYTIGELQESSTIRKFRIVQNEGNRQVSRDVVFYNLDMIIAIGYRVNSREATCFRIWATQILKEYMIKGFALDDSRLKNGGNPIYQQELIERIRDIRSSEKQI